MKIMKMRLQLLWNVTVTFAAVFLLAILIPRRLLEEKEFITTKLYAFLCSLEELDTLDVEILKTRKETRETRTTEKIH